MAPLRATACLVALARLVSGFHVGGEVSDSSFLDFPIILCALLAGRNVDADVGKITHAQYAYYRSCVSNGVVYTVPGIYASSRSTLLQQYRRCSETAAACLAATTQPFGGDRDTMAELLSSSTDTTKLVQQYIDEIATN